MGDLEAAGEGVHAADMGMEEPGLNRLIRAAFDLLGLQTYFTAGVKEVRAWTIHKGDTAPQAAGVIHTDFEKGYIRAQTISFDDFIQYKGEAGSKEAGKMRAEGKEYVVKDGDVLNFLFNSGYAGLPKGSVPFHSYGEEERTAFAEHCVESSHYMKQNGKHEIHFTIPAEHRSSVENLFKALTTQQLLNCPKELASSSL